MNSFRWLWRALLLAAVYFLVAKLLYKLVGFRALAREREEAI